MAAQAERFVSVPRPPETSPVTRQPGSTQTARDGNSSSSERSQNTAKASRQVRISTSGHERWPFPLCCSVCTRCSHDPALCCYASTCPLCLNAEMQMKTNGKHCCEHFWLNCLISGVVPPVVHGVLATAGFCCCAHLLAPPLCLVTSPFRQQLAARYPGLILIECTGPCCAHTWCLPCALYQEAVFVKQQHGDYKCAFYRSCLLPCCRTPARPLWVTVGGPGRSSPHKMTPSARLQQTLKERGASESAVPLSARSSPTGRKKKPLDERFFLAMSE